MIHLLKLGGSLIAESPRILKYLNKTINPDNKVIIVPGGSIFADNIREIAEEYNVNDSTAHWMAILAMEQYAYYLAGNVENIELVHDTTQITSTISILLPYTYIRKMGLASKLPQNWDITSDSITAMIAHELGLNKFIKVTDVDGILDYNNDNEVIERISTAELSKMNSSCTDKHLPIFLERSSMQCIVVNGKYPNRIARIINEEVVLGTTIYPHNNIQTV